jgi:hypothetical protein
MELLQTLRIHRPPKGCLDGLSGICKKTGRLSGTGNLGGLVRASLIAKFVALPSLITKNQQYDFSLSMIHGKS